MSSSRGDRQHASAIRTFLIADIRGYTTFTAQHGDEAASRLATKLAQVAAEGIEAWGGSLVELRGDEALAVFDSPRSALRAALDLQAAFRAESEADPSLPLSVGIGLDVGEAAPVGDGFRGAALNMAARLSAITGAGDVTASQGLVQLAGPTDGILFETLDPVVVKGIAEPVPAVRIATSPSTETIPGLTESPPGRLLPTALPAELDPIVPIVGRKRELLWLGWHWRRTCHGQGRAVVVSGVPGIGKTRLAAEIAVQAHANGALVRYLPSARGVDELEASGGFSSQTPVLVVVDDLDAADSKLHEAVGRISAAALGRQALILITHRLEAPTSVMNLVERLASPERSRSLSPLDIDDVRAIAALYAGQRVDALPLADIADVTRGVPAAVHRTSSRMAREYAIHRLGDSAGQTDAGRRNLRVAEAGLVDDVSELELVRERSRRFGVEEVEDAAGRPRITICPYKGLASFEVADAEYYFGRERLVAEMIARLVGSSFLGLIGASGSGKSSALRAGLLPAIGAGVLPGSDRWIQAVLRPGERPLTELAMAVRRALSLSATPAGSAIPPTDGGAALDAGLAELAADQSLLLVVDQFEEVFSTTRDDNERRTFIDLLTVERRGLKVVIALRADFYGYCAAWPALARTLAGSHVLVGPMTTSELGAVIEHPAERVGLRVEPALTARLLADAGSEPGVLPLMSTSLLELWQARDAGRLTLAAYLASGGLQGAVARMAEAAYAELDPGQQTIARSILLRLAGPGEGEGVVRRRVRLAELEADRDPAVERVLETMTNARLLTTSDGFVEVAHEALLREWPRVQEWLADDAEGRRLRLHLVGAVRDWEQRGREPSDLYRGARLATALDWAAEHRTELNTLERDFLEQSRGASEADVAQQRRTNRRLRTLLAGGALLLLVALAAGGFAVTQLLRAEEQADAARTEEAAARAAQTLARTRELTASALRELDVDPDLGKLLAVEAGSLLPPDLATESALHQVFAGDPVIHRYTWPGDEAPWTDFDASGRLIVAAGDTRGSGQRVEVVDWATDRVLWDVAMTGDLVKVGNAFFSNDGAQVIAGVYWDAREDQPTNLPPPRDALGIFIWDSQTGTLVRRLDVGPCGGNVNAISAVSALTFDVSAENADVATCSNDGSTFRAELVDLASGARTLIDESASGDATISGDGRFVALTTARQDVSYVLEVATGRRVLEIDTEAAAENQNETSVRSLSPHGTLLAYGDRPIQMWDVAKGEVIASFTGTTGESFSVRFGPSDDLLYATGRDATMRQYDPRTGIATFELPAAGGGRVSPADNGLVLVMDDTLRTASVADLRPKGEVGTTRTCTGFTAGGSLAIAANFALVSTYCSLDSRFWTFVVDPASSTEVARFPDHAAQGFAASPDGTRFAQQETGADGAISAIRIRAVTSGDLVMELQGLCASDPNAPREDAAGCHPFPEVPFAFSAWVLRWSPDGRWLAAIDVQEGYVAIWDARTGELVHAEPRRGDDGFFSVIFTPDSTVLIGSTTGGALIQFSTSTWAEMKDVDLAPTVDGRNQVGLAGFLADGTTLVGVGGYFAGGGGSLHRIDSRTLAVLSSNQAHDGSPKAMAISPDGTMVATGASDGVVRIWDGPTGTLLHEFSFDDQIQGVAFVDDRHLAVAPSNGDLFVMTFDPQELLDVVRSSATRGFTEAECGRFGFGEACPTLEEIRGGG